VIRRGHRSLCEQCHPAPSRIITACSRRLSLRAHASRNACVIFDQPVAGSTAANTQIDFRPCWRTPVGRDPSSAHTAVSVPCCPNRASSCNQMRTVVRGREARTRFTKRGRDSGRQEAAIAWATRACGQRAWLGDRGFRCGVCGGAPRVENPRSGGAGTQPRVGNPRSSQARVAPSLANARGSRVTRIRRRPRSRSGGSAGDRPSRGWRAGPRRLPRAMTGRRVSWSGVR